MRRRVRLVDPAWERAEGGEDDAAEGCGGYNIAKPKLSVIGCSRYWCFTPEVSPDNFVFCIFDIELIKSIYEYFFIPLSNFAVLVFYT